MLLQIRFYEWAHRNNLQLIEMGIIQRSANQLISQSSSPGSWRDLSMGQGNMLVCAAVLQQRFLTPQRDLKLALGFIVCNRITFHNTCYSGFFSRFYANGSLRQHVL